MTTACIKNDVRIPSVAFVLLNTAKNVNLTIQRNTTTFLVNRSCLFYQYTNVKMLDAACMSFTAKIEDTRTPFLEDYTIKVKWNYLLDFYQVHLEQIMAHKISN